MDIWKFIKSFNTVNTYLMLSSILLLLLVLYFYVISPT